MKKYLCLFCLWLFAWSGSALAAPDTVTLILPRNTYTPAEETFTYAVPKQLGYFAQENIDVTLMLANGSTAALQAVAVGAADVAYASAVNTAAAIDKGVPLKVFAGITIDWPYFIGVPVQSDIQTIADLKGKRVGVISQASASYSDLVANLKLAGLTIEDIELVEIGAGARAAAAIKRGIVDAVDSYTDSFTTMEQNGVELRLLQRPQEMEQLFSVSMVTSDKVLREKRPQLVGFARAAYKGIIYSYLYPQSAVELSLVELPQLGSSQRDGDHVVDNIRETMQVVLGNIIPKNQSDPQQWGHWLDLPPSRWTALLQFVYDAGMTAQHLDVAQIWDASLMDEIYQFDIADIIEKP